ncbi:MAG: hypothetical protein ABSG76_24630 [Xanthobacteraceae bacterium]|jgi:hypothetical protein
MPDFAIAPPLHIRGHPSMVIRSVDQAADFVRRSQMTERTPAILGRLEKVRTPRDAQHARKELRAWLAEEQLLLVPPDPI